MSESSGDRPEAGAPAGSGGSAPSSEGGGGPPSVVQVAIGGLCPRCGARTLFDGVASFADKCRVCGLDFSRFNVGDGPAAFLTLIIGAVVLGLAIWLEFKFTPPLWVHALLWVPFTALAVVLGLRAGKAAMLALEYRNDAGEARTSGEADGHSENSDQGEGGGEA